MDEASGKVLSDIEEIKILVAILEVFHLLPSAATCFLEDLIREVINLEVKLKRFDSSPFKLPLTKYLNKYPVEAITYFFENITTAAKRRLFLSIISHADSDNLRLELSNRSSMFEEVFFTNGDVELIYTGIYLCDCLYRFDALWIDSNESLFSKIMPIVEAVGNDNLVYPERLNIVHILLGITKHFDVSGFRYKINQLLLDIALNPGVLNGYEIQRFLFEELVCGCNEQGLAMLFTNLPAFLFDATLSTPTKVYCLRKIITPVFTYNQAKLTADMIDTRFLGFIDTHVWTSFADQKSSIDISLSIEFLQLSTFLVQRFPVVVAPYQTTLFKGCTNLMKSTDVIIKYSAHVFLASCFKEFDCVDTVLAQFMTALLRAHQPECRNLVKQSLDILVKSTRISDSNLFWVALTKDIMYEENIVPNHFILIFNMFVAYPDKFGPFIDQFIGDIIITLPRLSMPPNGTLESKHLITDLGELILGRMDSVGLSDACLSHLLTFFIKFTLSLVEQMSHALLFTRCCIIVERLITTSHIDIDFHVFDKLPLFDKHNEKSFIVCNCLLLLDIVLSHQRQEWVKDNIELIEEYIIPWIKTDQVKVIERIHQTVRKCMSVHDDSAMLFPLIREIVLLSLRDLCFVNSCISFVSAFDDTVIAPYIYDVIKSLQKQIHSHLNPPNSQTFQVNSVRSESNHIAAIIELLATRLSVLGEYKSQFVVSLTTLIEESSDPVLLRVIFDTAKAFTRDTADDIITLHEKTIILSKMIIFSKLADDKLYNDYLLFVAEVYDTPHYKQSEITVSLQRVFLQGLTSLNYEIQTKFFDIFDDSLEKSLVVRMRFIIAIQNWDPVSNKYWICQALKLLLSCLHHSAKVKYTN